MKIILINLTVDVNPDPDNSELQNDRANDSHAEILQNYEHTEQIDNIIKNMSW